MSDNGDEIDMHIEYITEQIRDERDAAIARAEAAEAQVAKLREALADAASALAKAASAYRSNAVVLTYKDVVSKIDTAALRARAALAGKEPADG